VGVLLPCPGCGESSTRVIGGPGTKGGPQYWAGCDRCHWRTWGDTEAEAIAHWNRRAFQGSGPATGGDSTETAMVIEWQLFDPRKSRAYYKQVAATPAGKGDLPERLEQRAEEMDRRLGATDVQALLREAANLIRRLASAPVGDGVECVICGGDGMDPEVAVEARCCGRADPNGDCCGNPEPEPVPQPCRQCGGSGKVIPVPQTFAAPAQEPSNQGSAG
jgi:hypothetical protein